ncbi:MAG: response regulator [Bacteroidia bacterium]
MEQKKRIFIVDDHQIMIDGIRALLKGSQNYIVAGDNTNPLAAVDDVLKIKPEILITDISMPQMTGIDFTKKIKSLSPSIKVLALSMFSDRETVVEMLAAGIDAYVLKNTGTEELLSALDTISAGKKFFSDEVEVALKKEQSISKDVAKEINLTAREVEIVQLIADEHSNAQISEKLFISERTVETHRKNIFRKTGIKTVAGLVKYAIEHKLI